MTITNTDVIKKMLLLFLIFGSLYYAKEFLIPLSIGGILATLFLPYCQWIEKKLTKGLAVFICLMTLLSIIFAVFALLGWQISSLITDVTLIKQKAITSFTSIQEYLLQNIGISLKVQTQIIKDEQPSLGNIAQVMLGSFSSLFTNLILILVYVFSFLYYRQHIKNFVLKLTRQDRKNEVEEVMYTATTISQQYLLGMTKMIVCLWIMYGIGFSILGVPSAIFFAIICGLFEIVPFIGNITGTTLTVFVAYVNGGSLSMLGGIVITYGIVQFIQGWLLEPLILGPQVKINPLFTIIALVLGELVWGIPGIILAIPLTAIFKIICDHVKPLNAYGFLIGDIEYNT